MPLRLSVAAALTAANPGRVMHTKSFKAAESLQKELVANIERTGVQKRPERSEVEHFASLERAKRARVALPERLHVVSTTSRISTSFSPV